MILMTFQKKLTYLKVKNWRMQVSYFPTNGAELSLISFIHQKK